MALEAGEGAVEEGVHDVSPGNAPQHARRHDFDALDGHALDALREEAADRFDLGDIGAVMHPMTTEGSKLPSLLGRRQSLTPCGSQWTGVAAVSRCTTWAQSAPAFTSTWMGTDMGSAASMIARISAATAGTRSVSTSKTSSS